MVGVPARAFLFCLLKMIICYTVFNYVRLRPFFDNTHNVHQRIGLTGKKVGKTTLWPGKQPRQEKGTSRPMFWVESSWASSWGLYSDWLLSGWGTKTWQQASSGPFWESAGCMDASWQGRITSGMTRYGRKSMPAGSTPGSAPGVGNVFPSMIEVGDGKQSLEGTSIMDFPSLLS